MEQESESGVNKVYKVLFRGVILPGFDKDDVVKNVHEITRIPEAVITRKFFSGKTVVIRRADTQDYATRLQKTFSQAGIETYIEEILPDTETETETDDKASDSDTPVSSSNNKAIIITLLFLAIAAGFAFYSGLFDSEKNGTTTVQSKPLPVATPKDKPDAKIKSAEILNPAVPAPGTQTRTEKPSPSNPEPEIPILFSQDDIKHFIKITDPDEVDRLKPFINLFNLSENQRAAANTFIELVNTISEQTPLFIFSTTENFAIYTRAPLSDTAIQSIQSRLNKNSVCTSEFRLSLNHDDKRAVLSTFRNNDNDFYKSLDKSLLALNTMFASAQPPKNTGFYFYSRTSNYPAVKIMASKQQYLILSASISDTENHTGLTYNSIENFQDNFEDLWRLSLFYISTMSHEVQLTGHQQFSVQTISQLNYGSPGPKLSRYQKQLDIDFQPQWQSGPFAVNTHALLYENNTPAIEIQAKGQNIHAFIEYSTMASMSVTGVFDHQQRNVLDSACQSSGNSVLFKNTEGEQEAFINNDFVSFQTLSALQKINLQAGTTLQDVSEIQGQIELHYPEQIHSQTIKPSEFKKIHSMEGFIFRIISSDLNNVRFQILGNTRQFIALRAYSHNGEVLVSTDFQYQERLNHSILDFKQSFAGSIAKLEILYSPSLHSYYYPFKFKPGIRASQPLNQPLNDLKPVTPQDKPDFGLLDDTTIADNPQWLGENLALARIPPFYISLFKQESDTPEFTDAIINIKLASTPLVQNNLGAVQLSLKQADRLIFNDFIHFTNKKNKIVNQDFLDSNTAIQMDKLITTLQGNITLSLPREFNTLNTDFTAPGQLISTQPVKITLVRQTSRYLEFTIHGDLKTLVQLKVYDKDNVLISDLLEYNQQDKTHARIKLFYYGKPASLKLVTGSDILTINYHFEL